MVLSDLHSKITDLQQRVEDLRKSSSDPEDALTAAMEELAVALEELDAAQEELCQQDESLQSAYQTIEAEHRRYLGLFNFAPDGYLATDLEGTIKEANRAASGLLQSELTGHPLAAFLEKDNLESLEASLDRLKMGGTVLDWEVTLRSSDGTIIPVLISANAICDVEGNPCGLRWMLHDITRRKKAEEELAQSEEKYRLLVENANEAIVVAQDGMLKFVNPKVMEVTGFSMEELLSMQFFELIYPDDLELVMKNHIKRLKGERAQTSYAFRIIDCKGEIKWAEINPVKISWKGRPATLNLISDITKRKLAEDRLSLFESAVKDASDGVMILVPDPAAKNRLRIDYINPAFKEMTGYDEGDVIGRHPEILSGPETDPVQLEKIAGAVSRKEPVRVELINYRKDGTKCWSELSLVPLLNEDNEASHWVSFERDTTERHRQEEEVKRAKGALHENLNFLQSLMDTIPNSIFYKGRNGRYLGCNKALEDFLGMRKDEIIGRSVYELNPKDIADRHHKIDEALYASPGTWAYESPVLSADGASHDVLVNKATYTDADGSVAGIVGVILDIDDSKRPDKTLQEEEELIRIVPGSVKEHIAVLDKSGKIVAVNSKWERFVTENLGRQSIIGMNYLDLYKIAMKGEFGEEAVRAQSGIRAVIDGTLEEFCLEHPYISREGKRWFLLNVMPITGDPGGAVVSHTDVTERKLMVEALRKSKDYLNDVMNPIWDLIFIKD